MERFLRAEPFAGSTQQRWADRERELTLYNKANRSLRFVLFWYGFLSVFLVPSVLPIDNWTLTIFHHPLQAPKLTCLDNGLWSSQMPHCRRKLSPHKKKQHQIKAATSTTSYPGEKRTTTWTPSTKSVDKRKKGRGAGVADAFRKGA